MVEIYEPMGSIGPEEVRFFDFEDACFRHPLVDAMVLRFPYPTGAPPWRVPNNVEVRMESEYLAELAQGCAIGQDDGRFEREMAAACIAWAIMRLARLPKVDAGPDRDPWLLLPPRWSAPVPFRSRRRQLVAIIETAVKSGQRVGEFPALTGWCVHLLEALRGRWPEAAEELSLYSAFG